MTERFRKNRTLVIGMSLLSFFCALAVLGPFVAPYSPEMGKPLVFRDSVPVVAPSPPDSEHWFGKDPLGRDLFSLMLYGLRHTLIFAAIVAFFRILIGTAWGIWNGMKLEQEETIPKERKENPFSVTGLFGSIPTITLLIILFSLPTKVFSYGLLVLLQGSVLILFGISPIASTIRGQTRWLKNRLSVVAAKLMGATKGWLVRKHIIPMLKGTMIILFIQDMILILNILGQLSLFRIFLGGTEVIQVDEIRIEYYSKSFEWVGLMGQNKAWVITNPYLIAIPLLLYLLLLLSFFLVAKGLENRERHVYSKYPHI